MGNRCCKSPQTTICSPDIPICPPGKNVLWRDNYTQLQNVALVNALTNTILLADKALTKKATNNLPSGSLMLDTTPVIPTFNITLNVPNVPELININIDGLDNYEMNNDALIIRGTDTNDPNLHIKASLSGQETEVSWGLFTFVLRKLVVKPNCDRCYKELARIELDMQKNSVIF